MAVPVAMPRQGQSVESCIITEWHYKKGEQLKEGDILLSYETDKASFELESPAEGILLETFFTAGDEVPVLANIAVIGKKGEKTDEFRPDNRQAGSDTGTTGELPGEQPDTSTVAAGTRATLSSSRNNGKQRISPRARKMALELNIPLETVNGSGPYGRIIAEDITRSAASAQGKVHGAGGYTDTRLSNVRKIIGSKMHQSLQNSAQLTHHISADARRILAYRASFKSLPEGSANKDITINDMISYAVCKVLLNRLYLNSHFLGDSIRTFESVHLGFAVDTERGLMVPVIRHADSLNLTEMSVKLKGLAEKCKQGNIDPELLQSTQASFTISNLGSYGIEMFTPILNLPQAGILGVNTITRRPADTGDGTIGMVPYIGLSLTYDHRAVDGAPASAFLKELKEYLESFEPVIG